jgi:hypothetical protein
VCVCERDQDILKYIWENKKYEYENPVYDSLMLVNRNYELTNHLGNVLSTFSDKKIGSDSSGTVNYYSAEDLSQNDYYPFGADVWKNLRYTKQVYI